MNPPKSVTLSKLKQSELKMFDENFKSDDFDRMYYTGISLGYAPDDFKNFISSSIEKAYKLGKTEVLERVKLETDACICECGEKWSETDLADYVNKELNLLKNK